MPIVAEFGSDVEEYIEFDKQHNCLRPDDCVNCGAVGQMIGHGYYRRKPKDLEKGWVLWVKRLYAAWVGRGCSSDPGARESSRARTI